MAGLSELSGMTEKQIRDLHKLKTKQQSVKDMIGEPAWNSGDYQQWVDNGWGRPMQRGEGSGRLTLGGAPAGSQWGAGRDGGFVWHGDGPAPDMTKDEILADMGFMSKMGGWNPNGGGLLNTSQSQQQPNNSQLTPEQEAFLSGLTPEERAKFERYANLSPQEQAKLNALTPEEKEKLRKYTEWKSKQSVGNATETPAPGNNSQLTPEQWKELEALKEAGWTEDQLKAIREAMDREAGGNPDDPYTQDVRPEATVQNQIDSILAQDSPLMQRAGTQGRQYANSRGLLNSSIASEAAQNAMIDAALPIAQQDAATYAEQDLANQQYENQFRYGERQFGYERTLQDDDQEWRSEEAKKDRDYDNLAREDQQAYDAAEAALDRDLQKLLNQNTLTASQVNTIMSGAMDMIASILADPNLKPDEKQVALDNAREWANAQIKWFADLNGVELPEI